MGYNCGIKGKESEISGRPPVPKEGEIMAVSKKQQACVARYSAKNYDQFLVRVKKGRKDEIQAHADAHGESVNGFVVRAISEAMERDSALQAAQETEE